jgi:lipid-A-disaccharide synthase
LRKTYPDATFILPKPHGLHYADYKGLTAQDPFFFLEAPAYDLRQGCDLAWVKSGTSTLETALLGTPMVVVYKVAALTGFLAKRLLKIKNVSLVNLLSGATIVPELLQENATAEKLVKESLVLLEERRAREKQIRAFAKIKQGISKPPKASQNAAKEILKLLK